MAITQELYRLGNTARRLNDGSDELNRHIASIDGLLGRLMIGLDYVHRRPLAEQVAYDTSGKRVIELSYVAYLKMRGSYTLAIKTVKVVESRGSSATEQPGDVTPLLKAPRRLRYAAVDVLPELVSGLAEQAEDMVANMDRRCEIASGLVRNLEQIAGGPVPEQQVAKAAVSATSHRRQTIPAT